MKCTFFGHHDTPSSIKPILEKAVLSALNEGVCEFYVGNNGSFDLMVQKVLCELSLKNPAIKYSIVLSYINEKAISGSQEATIFPEGLESALPRFAIAKRNDWLIKNSSVVIAYSTSSSSNSNKYVEKARKNGLTIINLVRQRVV